MTVHRTDVFLSVKKSVKMLAILLKIEIYPWKSFSVVSQKLCIVLSDAVFAVRSTDRFCLHHLNLSATIYLTQRVMRGFNLLEYRLNVLW